jgi:formamidopyrimidine-DNA glycosylase
LPELPEAETIARSLAARVAGRRIVGASYPGRRVWRGVKAPQLRGRTIRGVSRYGKQVLLELDRGWLLVRLGMTGALLVDSPAGAYTRAEFQLDCGRLLFDDIRQFGWFEYMDQPPVRLGPDPLAVSPEEFASRLRSRRTEVKRLLLDQTFVRGIGNIYADEALFRAGIHPKARTEKMSPRRAERLRQEVAALLEEAIASRGSSVSDYVDAGGERGEFQLRHQVYRKHGQPCPRCGKLIRRIVIAQRGTHFCAVCQRL